MESNPNDVLGKRNHLPFGSGEPTKRIKALTEGVARFAVSHASS